MAQMLALVIVVAVLFIGDMVSVPTKAWYSVRFRLCRPIFTRLLDVLPAHIVAVAGVPPAVASLMIYLLITNMGTLFSIQQLKEQWKTVLISMSGIFGIVVVLFTIGTLIFDFQTVVVAIPPLVGGIVSALIMSEVLQSRACHIVRFRNRDLRNARLCRLSVNLDSAEQRRKKTSYKIPKGELAIKKMSAYPKMKPQKEFKLFHNLPKKYNTDYFKFSDLPSLGF